MSPTKKFFSGNTLEQAVLQAARHFQLDPEEVGYEPVERRHGFLKVRRRVVIGVDPEQPRREQTTDSAEPTTTDAPEPEFETREVERPAAAAVAAVAAADAEEGMDVAPQREQPPSGDGHLENRRETEANEDAWKSLSPVDATEAAEEALKRVFRLGGLDLSSEVTTTENGLEVELGGPDEDHLFEDRGRLLLALQHLLPRMIRGLTGASVPCRVDSDNFHEVRAEQLRMLAQDAAAEVRRERRMQTLEPMSPDERRIVHLTLAEDPAVETESHGTGLFKRVAVRPVGR